MRERGIPRHGYPICFDGEKIGVVTSGSHSPSLGEPIGLGYVPARYAEKGFSLDIMVRNKSVKAEVVETPFYKRG